MWRAARRFLVAALLMLAPSPVVAQRVEWIDTRPAAPGLSLAGARVVTDSGDHAVVALAAEDLRRDLERVTGIPARAGGVPIWAGTIGRNPAIDRLIASGRLDARRLTGAWESFVIATVPRPAPGIPAALVIAGSDRRGTAFGIYELSRAIGVSPWHWWADVAPLRHADLRVRPGTRHFGPPSVKYRGIFLNDEDWGLAPWAAGTSEPEAGGIGPRTYSRIFELLLRLKANTLWPAMHRITPAFNADPANARLADRHAIVMGSSHAEPMLRNNVREWQDGADRFNYATNRDGVRRYWEQRVATNAAFETIYTLGMRGIHDSGMVGPTSVEGRRALLEQIFADQRAMIAAHVDPRVERVPQMFAPYKEVLDIYRAGLRVPDDVTILWPDDNFGYIRRFPDAAERRRAGGSGVYYHLSYLGAPLSYLWLSTTPPALIREEMGRAYDAGADRIWIANVGDIKPAELATDYFLALAWDVPGTRARTVDAFVRDWAAETIDAGQADAVAQILATHHRLNFERRPEHLQWWLPGDRPRPSPLSVAEADARLADFAANTTALAKVSAAVPQVRRDALFELVGYPVEAAGLANQRFFAAEAHDRLRDGNPAEAMRRGAVALAANARLRTLTRAYNETVAGGKWRGFMAMEPADGQWKSYRLTPPVLPAENLPAAWGAAPPPPASPAPPAIVWVEAEAAGADSGWRRIDGLGRGGASMAAQRAGASLSFDVDLPPGQWTLAVDMLPTYPTVDGAPLRLSVTRDGVSVPLAVARVTGDRHWASAVLDNSIRVAVPGTMAGGRHRILVRSGEGGGLVLDRLRFEPAVPAPH